MTQGPLRARSMPLTGVEVTVRRVPRTCLRAVGIGSPPVYPQHWATCHLPVLVLTGVPRLSTHDDAIISRYGAHVFFEQKSPSWSTAWTRRFTNSLHRTDAKVKGDL